MGVPLGSVATFVLLYPPGLQLPAGPVIKNPNASLKALPTNSGYSSEPKENRICNSLQ